MHQDVPGLKAGATETLHTDRQIGALRCFGRLREVAVGIDQRRIEMQTGIQQGRMQPGLSVNGKLAWQSDSRQDLAVASPQRLDGAKRCAILQSQSVQGFVVAVDRNQAGASLPVPIEL